MKQRPQIYYTESQKALLISGAFLERQVNQSKIDKLDAQLIAHYEPALSKLKLAVIRLMSDLISRRGQLITLHTMEKNRLCIMPKGVPEYIKPI